MQDFKKKAALFLACQGVSLFGSSIVQFAIIWYVTLQTASGIWVSLFAVASYLPQFIISFFSGVWADRYSKKKLIIISDLIIALSTLILIISFPYINSDTSLLIFLLVISVIRSLGTGIQTPAVNSVIPQIVPQDKLMKFNGTNSLIQSLVQFVAPIVAGTLLSLVSFQITLSIDILTAIIGVSILAFIKIPFVKGENTESMFKEMKAGISYARQERFIGALLLLFGLFIFLCVPTGFLSALFVKRYYGDTYWYLSLVEVIGFIGMTAGGLVIGTWGGFKNRVKTLVVGMISFGILAILMGAIDNFVCYLIMMAIYGVALTMVQTASVTLLQEKTAIAMQGRVFGLFGAIYSGFLPLGMLAFGPLADVVSLRLLGIISGILLLVLAIIVLTNRRFYQKGLQVAVKKSNT